MLAREMSLEEIARLRRRTPPELELEAFVHGALCVSYSGRCYMSEVLLDRSANRGCCAQMCRMRYDLLDADGNEIIDDNGQPIHQRYLLSLQDLDRSAYLQELIDAGVTTFKIEGRLKDATYVANVTAYYRQRLDAITGGSRQCFTRSQEPDVTKTFHRGGTDYFMHGRTRPMANWDTPKSTGEYIGEIESVYRNTLHVRLKASITLHNGDGLTAGDEGFNVNDVQGETIKVNKDLSALSVPSGTKLYRNSDPTYLRSLHFERRIPVDVVFTVTDNGYRLTYTPLDTRLRPMERAFAAEQIPATNAQRAEQTVAQQLTKLGETIYTAHSFRLENMRADRQIPFIPIAQLNTYRRETIQ